MKDYLIIGGGINGLLLAHELAATGAQVLLLEQGSCCSEASWAGGGIVSPLYPWRYSPAVTALSNWAQDYYPELSVALAKSTTIDPEYTRSGLLMLAAEDSGQALHWARENNRKMAEVNHGDLYTLEPGLGTGFTHGLWMSEVANIRNPRLGQALVADLNRRVNIEIRENCEVTSFAVVGKQVTAVESRKDGKQMSFKASHVIVCAGAWSGLITDQLGVVLPIEPVKGQMLLYKFDSPPLNTIILNKGRYVIPRADGHVLVGSTLEYEGFDKTSTNAALLSLKASAEQLLPALKRAEPVRQWAGLRPAAPHGIPFIGLLPGFENVFVNAGQFRNGLVLAPASARLLADILLERKPIVNPDPYSPELLLR